MDLNILLTNCQPKYATKGGLNGQKGEAPSGHLRS
jgi:hypothetical protein